MCYLVTSVRVTLDRVLEMNYVVLPGYYSVNSSKCKVAHDVILPYNYAHQDSGEYIYNNESR